MNNFSGTGKQLAVRVVLLQAGCAAAVALMFLSARGAAAAVAALTGGSIVTIGTALFGWRLFAPGIAPPAVLQRALFAAESLKWFWYVSAMWAALAWFKLMPLPLMVGLIVAQFGYWFGLVRFKRG